jgi:hypothetical protein
MLIVFVHLIATCMAIGVIVMTDMRLLAKLAGYRVVIPPPERFETRMIVVALSVLIVSGTAVVAMGTAANPLYLHNPKLQAKLLLVGLLCLNAFALHHITFPRLARARPVSSWSARDHLSVALPVGMSNGLWFYCAFLGIARPWNFVVPIWEVLLIALLLMLLAALGVLVALRFAARDEPQRRPDWIDSVKARLSDRMPLGSHAHSFESSRFQDTLF